MHDLPKMQCFRWFSFCQVDEENNGETVFMPVSVELTRAYGSSSSGKCGPKEASFPAVVMSGNVGSLSLFFSLFSSPARLALLSPGQRQRADWVAAAKGQLQGSSSAPRAESPAARDKCKGPAGLLIAVMRAGLGAGVSNWVEIQRKEAKSRKESSGSKLNLHLEGQLQMLQIS